MNVLVEVVFIRKKQKRVFVSPTSKKFFFSFLFAKTFVRRKKTSFAYIYVHVTVPQLHPLMYVVFRLCQLVWISSSPDDDDVFELVQLLSGLPINSGIISVMPSMSKVVVLLSSYCIKSNKVLSTKPHSLFRNLKMAAIHTKMASIAIWLLLMQRWQSPQDGFWMNYSYNQWLWSPPANPFTLAVCSLSTRGLSHQYTQPARQYTYIIWDIPWVSE